jgi:hypothetical protein
VVAVAVGRVGAVVVVVALAVMRAVAWVTAVAVAKGAWHFAVTVTVTTAAVCYICGTLVLIFTVFTHVQYPKSIMSAWTKCVSSITLKVLFQARNRYF